MPQKIICEGCDAVLLDDSKLRPPGEIIKEFDGKCPSCGKKLIFNPDKIEMNIL